MTTLAPDRRAWIRSAIDEHQGRLIRFAVRITGDLESARDVVQDTFLKLCREEPDRIGHLAGWLFRVCRNRALDVLRKEGHLQRLDDCSSPPVAGPEADPERLLAKDETQRLALAAIGELSPARQEALRLRFQEGLSYKEISAITGKSVSHVGVLIHEGVKHVRQRLSGAAVPGRAS